VRGFMYTPWTRKYELLPEFARLLGFAGGGSAGGVRNNPR